MKYREAEKKFISNLKMICVGIRKVAERRSRSGEIFLVMVFSTDRRVGRSRLNERTSSVGGGAAAARCSAAWPSSFLLEPFLFDLGALGGRACHAGRTGGACRGTEGESRVKRAFVSWKERMATTLESPFLLSHLYSTMRGPFSIPS